MTLAPFSLQDAPAFIERGFPVTRLSAEAYKERKAGSGQTLTALGSYWKGRKPLILCRAVTLGCLLPATDDAVGDLSVFLQLMAMDDAAFGRRWGGSAAEFARAVPERAALAVEPSPRPRWRTELDGAARHDAIAVALTALPYAERVRLVRRPEECGEALLDPVWPAVNAHLGTVASSLPELVKQLGIARFGHRPRVADTFCGGGSIPFEAARIGCDVYASDLNPVAAMLTWGAFNIIGAMPTRRAEIAAAQAEVAQRVDAEVTAMEIEHDAAGNRAKAYLYCLETRCPKTGWMVPMAPSWVISKTRNVAARLMPDPARMRYDIVVETGLDAAAMVAAERGTVQGGRLVHPMNPDRSGVEIRVIRGDRPGGGNALRPWTVDDFVPRPDDIWQERLYCVQWITAESVKKGRPVTFFAGITGEDMAREARVEAHVRDNLAGWQADGLVPDMPIDPGDKTDEPIRTRGWMYWHHLFGARHLLLFSMIRLNIQDPSSYIFLSKALNRGSKLCRWNPGAVSRIGNAPTGEKTDHVFLNQALNTLANYVAASTKELADYIYRYNMTPISVGGTLQVDTIAAVRTNRIMDVAISDPPYADAVNYHEITEFFIAWLRKNPPPPFDQWTWNSRRDLAIKGQDAGFRRAMVDAYAAMTRHMPDTGMQVVMFTHQDAGVWADLAGILWAAGLRVTAAWNVVTETESAQRVGNYVQGTVCLVLRKRLDPEPGGGNARRMDLEAEIEEEVRRQLGQLTALTEGWTGATGGEALYTDGDLTLAAYAAALTVVTSYATIDRRDVGADVFRELKKTERTPLRDLIDYAAGVANRELVPQGVDRGLWRDLPAASRFYLRMADMEARGAPKVADFQNFARSFALSDHTRLMASAVANAARLAGPADLRPWRDPELKEQPLFQVLAALRTASDKQDPKLGVAELRNQLGASDYWARRVVFVALARILAIAWQRTRPEDAAVADELAQALEIDRL